MMKNEHSNKNPSTQLTQEEVLDALPGYVLGILEPDEMLAVDAYLQQHPELRARVDNLDTIAMDLALSAPPVIAPPALKTQVMARARAAVTAESQSPSTGSTGAATADAAKTDRPPRRARSPLPLRPTTAPTDARQPVTSTPTDAPRPWWAWLNRPFTWQFTTVAATIVLVAVIVTALRYQNSLSELESQLASQEERIATLERENETLQQDNVALRREITAQAMQLASLHNSLPAVADPERVVTLDVTEQAGDVNLSGSFYVAQDNGLLLLRGLQPLPESETYQLWLIPDGGNPVSAGLISVADDAAPANDVTVWTDTVPLRADQFSSVGVSVEPAGGSPAPTGPIILLGSQA